MCIMYISKHNYTTENIKNYSSMLPNTVSNIKEIRTYI